MELFAEHLPFLIATSCFTELSQRAKVSHVALHDLLQFVLSAFNSVEVLHAEDTHHFRNPIINKGSEVEHQHLRDIGVHSYSSKNQVFVHHLVSDNAKVIYVQGLAKTHVWFGWWLNLCDLDERKSHFI